MNTLTFLGCFNYFPLEPNRGDVIIYNCDQKEYLYTGKKWENIGYYCSLDFYENKDFPKITHCNYCGAPLPRWEKWMNTNKCEYCGHIYYR